MAKYAVLDNNTHKVLNCIEWDGVAKWSPPQGTYLIKADVCDREDIYDPKTECFTKENNKQTYHKDFDCHKMRIGEACPIGSKVIRNP